MMPAHAVSERSFSAMRRLLTYYLRSSMSKNRLNNSMVLHMHKEHLDTMSLIDIANDFIKDSDHRMYVFGQFHQSDMRTCLPALTKSIGIQVDMKYSSACNVVDSGVEHSTTISDEQDSTKKQ